MAFGTERTSSTVDAVRVMARLAVRCVLGERLHDVGLIVTGQARVVRRREADSTRLGEVRHGGVSEDYVRRFFVIPRVKKAILESV